MEEESESELKTYKKGPVQSTAQCIAQTMNLPRDVGQCLVHQFSHSSKSKISHIQSKITTNQHSVTNVFIYIMHNLTEKMNLYNIYFSE